MVMEYLDASDFSRIIAPVFLLAGIGSFMNVIGNRLGRITDRSRFLTNFLQKDPDNGVRRRELEIHVRRLGYAVWSIGFCVTSALIICTLVSISFLGKIFHFETHQAIAILYVLSMLSLILALLLFLLEIRLAIQFNWVKHEHEKISSISSVQ